MTKIIKPYIKTYKYCLIIIINIIECCIVNNNTRNLWY